MKKYFIHAELRLKNSDIIETKVINGIYELDGPESIEPFVKDKFGLQYYFRDVSCELIYHNIQLLS